MRPFFFLIFSLKKIRTMKKPVLVFIISSLIQSCDSTQPPKQESLKTLVTLLHDKSLSYQTTIFDSSAIAAIMYRIAETGGVLSYVVVDDNATRQSVWLTDIPKCDTTATDGNNIYLKVRQQEQNKKEFALFQQQMKQKISALLAETQKHKPSKHTDLQRGLELCKTCCEPNYKDYRKYIVVMSDMLIDVPNSPRAHLQPVQLCNASILIVRPSPAMSLDSLQRIFPDSKEVIPYTTIQSAINYINQ